ncbi:MAG: TonB-dependent receptor [Elusimicrobia bacterium]|nr:TonB-dependent receptor [Elusimicrobiota bacterium]
MNKLISAASLCLLLSPSIFAQNIDLQLLTTNPRFDTVVPDNSWAQNISVGQVLEQYAPVQVKSSGFGSSELLNIRGQSKGIQFYLDGAPLPMDSTGFTDMSTIPTAVIDHVEIQKGFSAGSTGGAGAVYIYTKTPQPGVTLVDASSEVSKYKTNIFNAGVQSSALNIPFKINYSQDQSDGFQQNSGFDKKSFNLSVNLPWDYAPIVSYLYTDSYMGLPGGTDVPVDDWNGSKEQAAITPDDWMHDKLNSVTVSRSLGRLNYSASYTNLDRSSLMYGSVSEFKTDDAAAKLEYAVLKQLALGADWHYSQLDTNATYFTKQKFDYNIYSGYAIANIPIGFLDAGLSARYDRHDYWNDNLSYKAQLSTRGKIKLFAAGSSAVMFPSIADYDSNPDTLKPEQNMTAEIGAEGTAGDLSFKTNIFYSEIKDKVAIVQTGPFIWQSVNVGKGRNSGLEAALNYNIGDLRNTLIYNFADYQINPYGTGGYEQAQFAPQNIVRLNNVFTAGKWEFLSMLNWTGTQYTDMGKTGVRLPAYVDWTLSVERKIGQGSIYGGVRNMLNQHYAKNGMFNSFNPPGQQNILYPNPPLTFFLGVKYKLFN